MGIFDRFKKYIATEAEKVKDPVCGMMIINNENVKSIFNEKTYYFCSITCKAEFDRNPTNFVKQK